MINKITKSEYPEIWDIIIEEEDYDKTYKEHRRGPSFYTTLRYNINSDLNEYLDGNKIPEELYGLWETDILTWSDDWGLDTKPEVLYRIKEVVKIIEEKCYVRVNEEE